MSGKPEVSNLLSRLERFIAENKLALFDKHSIAFAIGCHPKNAAKALDSVHHEGRVIVDHWIRINGQAQPVYRTLFRGGSDAKKPDPLPVSVRRASRRTRPEVRQQEAYKKRIKRRGGVVRLGVFGI